ncbi:MAG: hypothetical protein QOH73_1102 [Gaiellaceae bacterium]|jgi:magnesium-transporting ATPase (P-type)|nr:hypothetical protein [Gaiellaceae bacterium]
MSLARPAAGFSRTRIWRLVVTGAVVSAVFAATADAMVGYYYAGPKSWANGQDASSSYATTHNFNDMSASSAGYDKMTTFVDNVSYSWHNTVRNTAYETIARWASNGTSRKGYCKAYTSLYAYCFVGNSNA